MRAVKSPKSQMLSCACECVCIEEEENDEEKTGVGSGGGGGDSTAERNELRNGEGLYARAIRAKAWPWVETER